MPALLKKAVAVSGIVKSPPQKNSPQKNPQKIHNLNLEDLLEKDQVL